MIISNWDVTTGRDINQKRNAYYTFSTCIRCHGSHHALNGRRHCWWWCSPPKSWQWRSRINCMNWQEKRLCRLTYRSCRSALNLLIFQAEHFYVSRLYKNSNIVQPKINWYYNNNNTSRFDTDSRNANGNKWGLRTICHSLEETIYIKDLFSVPAFIQYN